MRLFPVLAMIALPAMALAQTQPQDSDPRREIAQCAVIDGMLERLQCYDDLAKALDLDGPQPVATGVTAPAIGKWEVQRSSNPLDDSQTVVLALDADQGSDRWGNKVTMIIRCQSNRTEMYVAWRDYLGNDGDYRNEYKRVTIRVGDNPAATQNWGLSTDSKATFAPGTPIALIRDMAKADRFVAQVTPYNESPVTAIFDTTGLTEALAPVMEVCGWQL
ncbi:type VI secretion system-associated protein TagO [Aliiroseovarius sp.]|uniref:type VI secretion system-associated protein TagO n=1 Tax=Aliiroseovarius sp. TaxID=1872442 RepID=UPI003BABE74E